jgi:hypothetical protein
MKLVGIYSEFSVFCSCFFFLTIETASTLNIWFLILSLNMNQSNVVSTGDPFFIRIVE